jgi:hypothetical protein
MKLPMKSRPCVWLLVAAFLTAGSAGRALAGVIYSDTWQTISDANNYTAFESAPTPGGSPGSTLSTGVMALATENTGGDNTVYYLLNNGDTLAPGDSVSDVVYSITSSGGLGFTDGSLSGSSTPFTELLASNGSYEWDANNPSVSLPGFAPSPSQPATLAVTRGTGPNADMYTVSVSGGGLLSPSTNTYTYGGLTDTIYFGLGASDGTAKFESLTLTGPNPVPEPDSLVLLAIGALGLTAICCRRRNHPAGGPRAAPGRRRNRRSMCSRCGQPAL